MSPLNRSQYLQGDASEGPVLSGKVQGVKKGPGTNISADGTISVDAATAIGLLRLNNPNGFNGYIWPTSEGTLKTFLSTDSEGNLSWLHPSVSSSVSLGPTPPDSPLFGQLWFNASTRELNIFENNEGESPSQWVPVHRGMGVIPSNVTSYPDFIAGEGTYLQDGTGSPFVVKSEAGISGTVTYFDSVITVTGLTPHQYVPIIDIFGEENGYRFGASNHFANEDGVLQFRPTFGDFPASENATAFTSTYDIGFSGVYISAAIQINVPLGLSSSGIISGSPKVGEQITYTLGQAFGGVPDYEYSWVWRKASDSSVIQTNGEFLEAPETLVNDQVYVELTVLDQRNARATIATADFPPPPDTFQKGAFPATVLNYPQFSDQVSQTLWKDQAMTLYSSGCIEFSLNDTDEWGQGARNISNEDIINLKWLPGASCLGREDGSVISGSVFSESYESIGSFIIGKRPSPFSFTPVYDVLPGSQVTSLPVTPFGYNTTSYVTYGGTSSGTSIEGSLDGGATWVALPPLGIDTFAIYPGQTLSVRMNMGSENDKEYQGEINIGQGLAVQSAKFLAKTAPITTFTTVIPFPETTYQGYDSELAPQVTWQGGDGSLDLSATGCIEFRVNGGSWTQASTPITTSNTLETRWRSTAGCGQASHGSLISGTITDGATKVASGTLQIDRVPALFSFQPKINQAVDSVVISEVINLVGYNADSYLSLDSSLTNLVSPEARINGSSWAAIPAAGSTSIPLKPTISGDSPTTLEVRGTTGGSLSTTYRVVLRAGTTGSSVITTVWTTLTVDAIKAIKQPSITQPTNGATGVNPNSSSPPGVTLVGNSYTPLNGAGAHLSSSWEVRSQATGGPTVVAVTEDTENLTSYFIPMGDLTQNQNYYCRVRYHSTTGEDSAWSNWVQFRTNISYQIIWTRRFKSSLGAKIKPGFLIWTGSVFIGGGKKGVWMRSLDGRSWSIKKLPKGLPYWGGGDDDDDYDMDDFEFTGLAVKGNDLYVCGEDGIFLKSVDHGLSWYRIPTIGASTVDQRAMTYGNGIFVSVGKSGVIQTCSDDGVTWNLRASGISEEIKHVIFANGAFFAVSDKKILSSVNGVTWNIVSIPDSPDGKTLNRIAYRDGNFVVTRYLSRYLHLSTNGSIWSMITAPEPVEDVSSGGVWFVAGGSKNKAVLLSSGDYGSTWTTDYTDTSHIDISATAYSPVLGRWAALGYEFVAYSD